MSMFVPFVMNLMLSWEAMLFENQTSASGLNTGVLASMFTCPDTVAASRRKIS